MRRQHYAWDSPRLGRRMDMLIFGHDGPPFLVFPTSLGSFFEYEDRGMVHALGHKLESGQLRLFCVSTVDSESFYAPRHPRERIDRYLQWERFLLDEMVPFVKHETWSQTIGVTGCSFGAYHAFTMALRHPDVFSMATTIRTRICSARRTSCQASVTTGFSSEFAGTSGSW
jgi:esterase/lipase superfamily enzyme